MCEMLSEGEDVYMRLEIRRLRSVMVCTWLYCCLPCLHAELPTNLTLFTRVLQRPRESKRFLITPRVLGGGGA